VPLRGLGSGANAYAQLERIPVEMVTGAEVRVTGRMQLIDNQVDPRSGTVRARAIFDNPDSFLMPGQFVRLRMGQPKAEPALLVSERAVGTDQNKKFVLVIDGANKASYRDVQLGPSADGLRVVTQGLKAGERIVVNGVQRVRPGVTVAPEVVPMTANPGVQAQN
jgi:membrane fusion protein, multidrug efflux system